MWDSVSGEIDNRMKVSSVNTTATPTQGESTLASKSNNGREKNQTDFKRCKSRGGHKPTFKE